jgi:hypothetical protein
MEESAIHPPDRCTKGSPILTKSDGDHSAGAGLQEEKISLSILLPRTDEKGPLELNQKGARAAGVHRKLDHEHKQDLPPTNSICSRWILVEEKNRHSGKRASPN